MYSVCKRFTFEAAHRLENLSYDSQCKNIHGHRYEVEIKVSSNILDGNLMVIDFTKLSKVKDLIILKYDHALIISDQDSELRELALDLKDKKIAVLYYTKTTSEVMAKEFAELTKKELSPYFATRQFFIGVKIYETENNYAEYTME